MSVIASQFGRPHGLLGRLAGRLMARGNADFNRWVAGEVSALGLQGVERVVEIGPGPGICLQETLRAFPAARVWGVDPSLEMLSQARRRNAAEIRSGRLVMVEGDVGSLAALAPVDLVIACHVLYFWHQPGKELALIRRALRAGGRLALGYQLRRNMPAVSQRNFPREGHVLYDADDQVSVLLASAGFKDAGILVKGPSEAPEGQLAIAEA